MAIPKIKQAFKSKLLFTADDFLDGIRLNRYISKRAIFTYSSIELNKLLIKELNLKKIKNLVYGCRAHYINRKRGLSLLFLSIGAPITAIATEVMASMGTEEFLLLGAAGGISKKLSVGDIVFCTKAIRDEGTFHHYQKDSFYCYPNGDLMRRLGRSMKRNGIGFMVGPTWTTDAMFRETMAELRHYGRMGIMTVEMETAALFSVARARKAKAAALFAISDIPGENEGDSRSYPAKMTDAYKSMVKMAKCFSE